MSDDIRIKFSFKDHRKRKKLARRLGCEAVLALVNLWITAAENYPDGVLADMDAEDIAIDAGWSGAAEEFLAALLDIGWIDDEDGVLVLHDWFEHNPWAATADDRSNRRRFRVMKRHFPEIYEKLKEQGVTAVTAEEYSLYTTSKNNSTASKQKSTGSNSHNTAQHSTAQHSTKHKGGEAPPDKKAAGDRIAEQAGEVLDYLNAKTGKRFKTLGLIPARLRDGRTVEECKRVIDIKVADRKFDRKYLDHTTPFRPDNFDKYLNQGGHSAPVDGGMIYENGDDVGWEQDPENKWARYADSDGSGVLPESRPDNGKVAAG